MTTVGPICHIPPVELVTNQPTSPAIPSVPVAQPNLASLTAAVNTLRQVVLRISGQNNNNNNNGGQTNNFTSTQGANKKGRWAEASRVVETVRVFNPNDDTQYVDVQRINKLVMKDGVTGEQWVWNREQS